MDLYEYGTESACVLSSIDEYEAGNEEYSEYVEYIYDEVKSSIKGFKGYALRYRVLLFVIYNWLKYFDKEFSENELYQEIIEYLHGDIANYRTTSKQVASYLKDTTCNDLKIAYLLSLKVTLILNRMTDEFNYIRRLIESFNSRFITMYPTFNRDASVSEIDEIDLEVKKLLNKNSEVE